MNGIVTLLTLLALVSAQHTIQCEQAPIDNANKVNAENEKLIITGNPLGEIGVCSDLGTSADNTVIKVHSAAIIFIERYLHDSAWEYVIVDQSGTVTIWNSDLSQTLATLSLNATAVNAAIREQTDPAGDNNLAINFKTFIVELSLNERAQLRRLDENVTFLALAYNKHFLIASNTLTTNFKLIYFNESGRVRTDSFIQGDTVLFLSKHNDNFGSDLKTAAGLTSTNRIVHITQNGISEITFPIYSRGKSRVKANYFGYCKSILKGGKAQNKKIYSGVIVAAFNDTIVLRSIQNSLKTIYLSTEIADISCVDQHLYVLHKGGKLELFELWQRGSREIFVAGAGLSLIVLVFAFVGYKVGKRWGKRKEGKQACVQTDQVNKEIELREFLIRESH